MKNRLTLNNENIAAALNGIDNILQRERIESNRIKCASLLLEEIMYIYRDAFSESADMKLETRKKGANLRIILSFPGKELNPDLAEETFVYKLFFGVFAQLSSMLLSIIGSFYISGRIVSFTESSLWHSRPTIPN